KAALCIRNGAIPPNYNFATPNPNIPVDELGIAFPMALTPWAPAGRRMAAVNSFGFGGTNACAILEEFAELRADGENRRADAGRELIVPLSAASDAALRASAAAMASALNTGGESLDVRDIAGTLALRRGHLPHRLAVVGSTTRALADAFEEFGRTGA